MANWKKVIVSGSDAHLNTVTASFSGDGSGLTNLPGTSLDIDSFSALGGATIAQGDNFVFSDAGTEKKVTFSNLEDSIFGNVSSDVSIAAGGAATIANDAVDNNKLANITRGSVKVGGTSNAPTDLDAKTDGYILIGDGTDVNSVAVSGDVTIDNTGATTIANDAVDNNKLANIARGSIKVGGTSNAPTDLNAKTDGYILIGDGTDVNSVAVSGDITIDNTGATTIAAGAIDFSMLSDAATGSIVDVIAGDVNVDAGGVSTIQANAVEGSMLNSNVAGSGLDYGSNQLSVDVSDFMSNGANNRILTATGTDAQNAEANLTFDGSTLGVTGDLTVSANATITGNLTVSGDYITANVTNLAVDDKFILLNSGSASGDAGIVFGGAGGGANEGYAIFWDDDATTFGYSGVIAGTSTGTAANSKLGNIETANAAPTSAPTLQGIGTIHIDTSLSGLSDNNIWIYS